MAIELVGANSGDLEGIRSALEIGNRNAADGFAGLDGSGNLTGTILHRTGTDAAIEAITLEAGEFAYTTDTGELRMGDGVTAGGLFIGGGRRQTTSATYTANGVLHPSIGLYLAKEMPITAGRYYRATIQVAPIGNCDVNIVIPTDKIHASLGPVFWGTSTKNNAITRTLMPLSTTSTFTIESWSSLVSNVDVVSVDVVFKAKASTTGPTGITSAAVYATTGTLLRIMMSIQRIPFIGVA